MHPDLVRLEQQFNRSVLTRVKDARLDRFKINVWIKRDDLLHPVISGNKWRKLKYILNHALSLGSDNIISMGGAYSNHLHALAYTGKLLGINTVGFIRGERPENFNPTLSDLEQWGMKLRFVSRSDYRQLRKYKQWMDLPGLKSREYWLPEGGMSQLALAGVRQLVEEIEMDYDFICVPCGTGTTLAGIVESAPVDTTAIGFAALKDKGFLQRDVELLLQEDMNQLTVPDLNREELKKDLYRWSINPDYHFGGFAKANDELLSFIKAFEKITDIPLEPVYTGKMMYGIYDLIQQNCFSPGQRIVAVHTGGLQGKRGFMK